MFVAVLRLSVAFAEGRQAQSRKALVHRLQDKLRSRFGASVADVEPNGPGDRATLGIALVSSNRRRAEADMQAVIELVERESGAHLSEELAEVYSLGELAAIGEPTLAEVEGVKHGLFDDREETLKQQRLQELRDARRRREDADE